MTIFPKMFSKVKFIQDILNAVDPSLSPPSTGQIRQPILLLTDHESFMKNAHDNQLYFHSI